MDNGTHQVVSGPAEEVHAFADQLGIGRRQRQAIASPAPPTTVPWWSRLWTNLQAVFDNIVVSPPAVPLVSNVTGKPVAAEQAMDGAYWRRHARSPVAFRQCVATLAADLGVDAVIELGPHAILGPLVSMNWPTSNVATAAPVVLQSVLRPAFDGSEPERADAFVSAVAGAYRAGLPVDFRGLFAGESRRKINIPGYPFQRQRFWTPAPQRRVCRGLSPPARRKARVAPGRGDV